jgi:hypothetical protein
MNDQLSDDLITRIQQNPNPRSFFGRLRAARKFVATIDRQRAFESFRTTFFVVGCAGFAGELAAMHTFLCIVSVGLISSTWYAIYLVTR